MVDVNSILKAVEAALQKKFPGEPVYWDELPKDFRRPSFTVECPKEEEADAAIGLVRRTVEVLVTCYAEVDAYYDSSRQELNRRMDGVLSIFGRGFLPVGDRSLAVQANKGEGAPDFAEVTARFSFLDGRSGYIDEDTAPESESGVPRMEDYTLHVDVNTTKMKE